MFSDVYNMFVGIGLTRHRSTLCGLKHILERIRRGTLNGVFFLFVFVFMLHPLPLLLYADYQVVFKHIVAYALSDKWDSGWFILK